MWKGRNLVPESLRKNEPSEYQYNSYTSEIAKALGDTMLAKEIKLSPIAIDNISPTCVGMNRPLVLGRV